MARPDTENGQEVADPRGVRAAERRGQYQHSSEGAAITEIEGPAYDPDDPQPQTRTRRRSRIGRPFRSRLSIIARRGGRHSYRNDGGNRKSAMLGSSCTPALLMAIEVDR